MFSVCLCLFVGLFVHLHLSRVTCAIITCTSPRLLPCELLWLNWRLLCEYLCSYYEKSSIVTILGSRGNIDATTRGYQEWKCQKWAATCTWDAYRATNRLGMAARRALEWIRRPSYSFLDMKYHLFSTPNLAKAKEQNLVRFIHSKKFLLLAVHGSVSNGGRVDAG